MTTIADLEKKLAAAQAASLRWAYRRGALPAGSSRARVTTANANWARAAEHRDRIADLLDKARAAEQPAPRALSSEPSKLSSEVSSELSSTIAAGSLIQLGRQTYTIAKVCSYGLELTGKRGASRALVQNQKNPTAWGLCGSNGGSEWYRRNADGTFAAF